jgi:heavy metal sensor kinase
MFRSLRFRLSLWYLAFFAVLFAVFGVFLHGELRRSLIARLDDTLASEAATAAGLLVDEISELGDAPKAAAEAIAEMRFRGSSLAVLVDGRVLASSGGGRFLEAAAASGKAEASVRVPGARAAIHRTAYAGRTYTVVALSRLDSIEADLQVLRHALLFGFPLVLALAGLGGYWLSARRLAPLAAMANQAREITSSSLATRLEIGNAAAELELLADSFNDLLARLDLSFDAMRRFTSDASHELRTPLSVIRGEADVALSRERTPREYRDALAIILDEAQRLSRLVDDLLNLARADAGRVRLDVAEFYLNDMLAECCRVVQPLASERQVGLACDPSGDVPFRGDERLLRRAALNLLDNAIRYTPSGGSVSASLEAADTEVRLRVSDTGIGIPADAAPHIFERFYRAGQARSREDGGFGLGLAIVKWIAESHHGAVALESAPGAGATFIVILPRA